MSYVGRLRQEETLYPKGQIGSDHNSIDNTTEVINNAVLSSEGYIIYAETKTLPYFTFGYDIVQ